MGPWRRAVLCPLCPTTEVLRPAKVGSTPTLRCIRGHQLVAVVQGGDGRLATVPTRD